VVQSDYCVSSLSLSLSLRDKEREKREIELYDIIFALWTFKAIITIF